MNEDEADTPVEEQPEKQREEISAGSPSRETELRMASPLAGIKFGADFSSLSVTVTGEGKKNTSGEVEVEYIVTGVTGALLLTLDS